MNDWNNNFYDISFNIYHSYKNDVIIFLANRLLAKYQYYDLGCIKQEIKIHISKGFDKFFLLKWVLYKG